MAITLSSAMKDIFGDNVNTSQTTTSSKVSSSANKSNVSQNKSQSGGITLSSAFNDIYGSDDAYNSYVRTQQMNNPIQDDENLQKKTGFWKNIFQTSKYYEDGYDRGDFLRTAADTGKSVLSSIAEGFLNTVEGIADWGQYRVSDVLDFFGATNAAESVKENAKFNSTASIFGKNTTGGDLFESGWKENLDKGSVLGRSGQQIFEGIGNIGALAGSAYLGGQIIGGVAPAATTTTFGQSTLAEIGASSVGSYVSAYGSARSNALNQGYSDADAKKAGVVSGLAEAISEQFFNGMTGLHTAGLGETVFGKVVPKTVTESMEKFFKTKAGKVASVILDGLEEGSEEIISNILTATGNDIAHLIDPNYSANGMDEQTGNWWKDVRAQLVSSESWDAFFSAMMTSALLGGANTMINNEQRKEMIKGLAEDLNISEEEAKGRLDLQESVQGQNERTIERTVYSNVDTKMDIEKINKIDNLKDLQDLESQLQEDLTQDRDTRTMTREELEPIVQKLNAVRARRKSLTEQMTPVEKSDELNTKLDEIQAIEDKTTNNMRNVVDNTPASPEVLIATDNAANELAQSIDKETTIPVAENKKDVRVRDNQVEEDAIGYINAWNQERLNQGLKPITVIQRSDWSQEQIRIAEALEAFGRHAIFARDLPGSFVTAETSGKTNLSQVLFINDKNINGLISKSNVTKDSQSMMYAVGHEMFHSLKFEKPEVYNDLVDYVANTISIDQLIKFMGMYDPKDTQGLLKDMQIDGKFNIEEVLANPKKYAAQYQALFTIAEEITANEFGGMFTDTEYMTNMAQKAPNLFTKIVEAIKEFFADLDKPIYNSPLTQLQITTLRDNFESIMRDVDNSLSTTTGLMNEINATNKNVANSQEMVYNTPQKEEGYDEFEQLQRESEELSDEEKQLYRSGSREIDDNLRRRLSTVFERRLESSRSSNSDEARVLTDPQSGNTFDVYENASEKTSFADVATAYNDANSGKISVEEARAIYDKYLADGGSQDVDIETALNGLENSVKKPKSTRQKLEKVTEQVNTGGQQMKSTRQKLPTKETVDQKITREFNRELKTNDAYLAFEEVIKNNNLSESQIDSLRQTAIDSTDSSEIQDSIRNWTPEIMAQENAEIQELNQKAKSIEDEEKKKEKTPIKRVEQVQEIKLPKATPIVNEEVKTTAINNDTWFKNIERIFDNYKNSTGDKQRAMLKSVVNAYTNYKEKGGTNIIQELEDIMASPEYKTQREVENAKKQDLFKDMMLSMGTINDNGTIRFLPNVEENTPKGKKVSKFFSNTITNSPFAQNIINVLGTNTDIKYYTPITNEDTLRKAMDDIAEKGEDSVYDFLGKENLDAVDVGKAVLLTNYYKLTGDLAKQEMIWSKLSGYGTKYGQFIQALSMLKYMSPEAVANSFQSDLNIALEKMKSSNDPAISRWIQDQMNVDQLTLTDAERTWIMEMVDRASKLDPDSHEYKVKMAQVYAYIANKIPKSFTNKLKTFRRLSMLANAKTQVRNVLGNVGALPVNVLGDIGGSWLDKRLARYTNTRTQGNVRLQESISGARQGYQESLRDKRLGINTQNINAYEFQSGQTFNNKTLGGKVLNTIERWTNFGLDLGDRPFEQAYYRNALANIMSLNGHEFATELDKQLARDEAEEKVWKNKGKMADLAIATRNTLNKVHIGELGLGDMILPFVLTPANLAAATYKYSPAAVLSVAKNAMEFSKTIKGNTTHEQKVLAQKKLVDSFGKMTAGTVLYAIAYAISKAGKITGGEDDDKEVAAMMKSLGWQEYSVKIGDKYYSYDWAEPFANPFAVMAEIQRQQQDSKFENNSELTNALQVIAEAFKIGGTRLQDQSFLASLQSIFSGQDSLAEGFIDFAAGLPASFVPTAAKQLADIMDGSAKMTYDKNSVFNTALNKMLVKIPGAKSLLPTKQTTLGNDARKYQEVENIGNLLGNIFNSTISPANVSIDTTGEIGEEFIDVYNHTGDATIMPQIAVKNITYGSEKYQFTLEQQANLQKAMGDIVKSGMNELLFNDVYNTASYTDKATALTSLVQYAKGKALEQTGYVPNYQIKSGNASQINNYVNSGLSVGEAVMYDSLINPIKGEKDANGDTITGSQNGAKAYTIMNMAISDKSKNVMLKLISPTSKTPETVNSLGNFNTKEEFQSYYSLARHDSFVNNKFSRDDIDLATKYFKFDVGNFTQYANELSDIKSDKDAEGNTISNSKKRKVTEYLNSLPLNPIQKTYLYSLAGYSIKPYRNELYNYINGLDISAEEKQQLWKDLGF